MATSTIPRKMAFQCGTQTFTAAASSQVEQTVLLPTSYSSGTDYIAFAQVVAYIGASLLTSGIIRNQSADRFIVRIYNSHSTIVTGTINWFVIAV